MPAHADLEPARPDGEPGRLTAAELSQSLAIRDLTDPAAGEHAVQHVVDRIDAALGYAWGVPILRDPGPRIVPIRDNYDRLGYEADAVTRDSRYTRYIDSHRMLRSHTSARIPALLDRLSDGPAEVLLSAPGICYRRDTVDRYHVGEPHQLDLWRIRRDGPPLREQDLIEMIELAVGAVLPGHRWYTVASRHPYTLEGREIRVAARTGDIEIGECGLAHPGVLAGGGLPPEASGLAMGLGLDRLTMLVKGIEDIRLLRAADPRIAAQMRDLSAYRPVSTMPATRRDLSLAVAGDQDAELLGDRVRRLLGDRAPVVEEIAVLAETPYEVLPPAARTRMGLRPGQKNLLLRVVLRDLDATLTAAEANALRDRIYAGLHEGGNHEWASPRIAADATGHVGVASAAPPSYAAEPGASPPPSRLSSTPARK